MTSVPANPKLYHIAHLDRMPSIIADGCLWSDAERIRKECDGTLIGIDKIKKRRLDVHRLSSNPNLHVGDCVPFYFCPRSVMLYMIFKANHPDLAFRGGQQQIVHFEVDLHATIAWVKAHKKHWAFTDVNAGTSFFSDWSDIAQLGKLDWTAIAATNWSNCKDRKQAEFLIEQMLPWELIERVGVIDSDAARRANAYLDTAKHKPAVEIRKEWYY